MESTSGTVVASRLLRVSVASEVLDGAKAASGIRRRGDRCVPERLE